MNSLINSSDFGEFEEEYLVIFFISTFTYLKKFILYMINCWKKKILFFWKFYAYNLCALFESKIVPNDTYNHPNRNQSKLWILYNVYCRVQNFISVVQNNPMCLMWLNVIERK